MNDDLPIFKPPRPVEPPSRRESSRPDYREARLTGTTGSCFIRSRIVCRKVETVEEAEIVIYETPFGRRA